MASDAIKTDGARMIREIVNVIAARDRGIAAAYLFGSQASGRARADSDVDLAVLYARQPVPALSGGPLTLEGELERSLGRRVQLVVLNGAPVDLAIRVLRRGRLVYERDRSARIRFEVSTRNTYFDLEPILRRCRRVG